ncbi:hypothetical protein JQS43_13295 [Natronosporangium hydrolyticum]|uniref:Lipoprotein n=1 Tax=Natronosporangium hydrolyticum TaxID=2811111 RepID=A0A895Y4R0_9ACTN|nr:hypothetical protein [Natronosporangium hydrolyticum]QSB12677.1 hypothetical protein JQS43_13295 [Natronosporangium hydrolyticum]
MRRVFAVAGAAAVLVAIAGCGNGGDAGEAEPPAPDPDSVAAPDGVADPGDGPMSTEQFCQHVLPDQLASLNQGATVSLNELADAVAAADDAQQTAALDDFQAQGGALGDGFRDAAEAATDPELVTALTRTAGAVDDFVVEVVELAEDGEALTDLDSMELASSEELLEASTEMAAFCEQ